MYGNFKVGQGSIVTTTFIHVPDYLQSGLESHLTLQNQTCNIFGALFSFRVTRRCNYCACVLITNAAMLGGSSGGHNVDRRIRIYSPLCRRCQPVMLGIIYSLIFFFLSLPLVLVSYRTHRPGSPLGQVLFTPVLVAAFPAATAHLWYKK